MIVSADYIFTPDRMLSGHVLEVNGQGQVLDLRPARRGEKVTHHRGVLCPGFVNAHCHLELSMLRGRIPEGLGMGAFVKEVVTRRNSFSKREEEQAIFDGIQELYFTGTVAIGDICNTSLSAKVKNAFPFLFSYDFVELLGLDGNRAGEILEKGKEALAHFSPPASLTLHAPYSASPELRDAVLGEEAALLSLHFLESEAELQLFREAEGPLKAFFQEMNIPFQPFPVPHPSQYLLGALDPAQAVILVHNTQMDETLLDDITTGFPNAWFCLCPRSNQYIHGQLPNAELFARYEDRVCIGTDSLASNHSLRMLEELLVLQQFFPSLSLHTLLKWACSNGAAALQQSDKFGSFVKGKVCGVNLIEHLDLGNLRLTPESVVRKII